MADLDHVKAFLVSTMKDLRARGLPDSVARPMLERAVRKHCGLLCSPVSGGIGQFDTEPEELRQIRAVVSPWLWALSIASFGLVLMNTRRISRMYGAWKKRAGAA